MYCSSPSTAWCQGMAIGFEKATGVRVTVTQKATGELYAQVRAEAGNPRGDVWWAGPGDAFLQAAEEGLLETYKSPNLDQLQDWAKREAAISKYRVAGVYGGILALGYNTELVAKKKLPVPKCWNARSGIGPMTTVTRGETAIGSTVLHGVVNEIVRGFPVQPVLPCEGVGYEVGSMAILKGARNQENH